MTEIMQVLGQGVFSIGMCAVLCWAFWQVINHIIQAQEETLTKINDNMSEMVNTMSIMCERLDDLEKRLKKED